MQQWQLPGCPWSIYFLFLNSQQICFLQVVSDMLILLLLTCGTNHITKAGLITAFHLLDIKMAWGLVRIVFALSESHIYLLFSEGMRMQVALGSTGCHIEIRLRIKLALRKAEGRNKNTWSLLIYLRDYCQLYMKPHLPLDFSVI